MRRKGVAPRYPRAVNICMGDTIMRVYNFSAGPSTLPLNVLEQAQREFLDFAGTGMSVTEISHRDKAFSAIVEEANR